MSASRPSVPGMTRLRRMIGADAPSRHALAQQSAQQEHRELMDSLRRRAQSAESADAAITVFREAVATSNFDPDVALEYARFLVQNSYGSSAEEVLALSLARNGAQPDALEIYLELIRELDLRSTRRSWVLDRLQNDIAPEQTSHRGALDFAIPFRLQEALHVIGEGADPVNRAIVEIDAAYQDGSFTLKTLTALRTQLGENDTMRAHLTAVLGRGDSVTAFDLLRDADRRAIPLNSLRRAIRRARADGRTKQVATYLETYLDLQPDDGWAKALKSESTHHQVSNYQLGLSGFPFPPPRTTVEYEARPDHVLYLLHNSLPHHSAGYATRTHGLLSELNRIGWDVDGVTRLGYPYDMPGMAEMPEVPRHETVGNVDYHRLLAGRDIEKKNPLFFYTERYADALLGLARSERPAILHAASNHWNGLTAVKTARTLGIPSIYEVRGLWEVTRGSRNPEWAQSNMYKYIARMEADAAKAATKVFTITEALRAELIDRGVDEGKVSVVPNGVDSSRFTPIARNDELAAQLGLTGKTVIGYVGSVLDYEGIELILEAAAVLRRTREDFHVLIVGDGAELERFRIHVQEHDLSDVVTFTGRVPHEEVERYYSLIDITPFPRLPLPVCEMVSPLKPFEAMAMGKAVVASDVAALAEIVTPGMNGFLHEKGSTESLIEQLTLLLDDRSKLEQIGARARAWVVENRDWKQLAQVIAKSYEDLSS